MGWKRVFDLFLSAVILILFSPALLLIAILVKINLGSPVFFIQERIGREGKIFPMIKFRSYAVIGDYSSTAAFTRFLRRFGLDELPQFINIVLGEMSLVGPRPIQPFEAKPFRNFPRRWEEALKSKPGLTGLWQVRYHGGGSRRRLACDYYYAKHATPWLDLWIIFKTFGVLISGKGMG